MSRRVLSTRAKFAKTVKQLKAATIPRGALLENSTLSHTLLCYVRIRIPNMATDWSMHGGQKSVHVGRDVVAAQSWRILARPPKEKATTKEGVFGGEGVRVNAATEENFPQQRYLQPNAFRHLPRCRQAKVYPPNARLAMIIFAARRL